jgi:PAS domain S-box-containing protein
MEIKVEGQKEKQKITLIAVLLAGSCFLTYYFHQVLQTGTVFTHLFYIPVILASLWWKRKGIAVALFLAIFLLFSDTILREYVLTANDYLRALMFVTIGVAVALLSERIAKAQEKADHLNRVLYAIRNVNQLITKEKDRDRLLKGACDNLTQTRGYYSAWIALLDENRDVVTTAESGLGKDFLPMADLLKGGTLTDCGKKALGQTEVVVTNNPRSTCIDCPLSDQYGGRGAMTVRLEHEGKLYGLLSASIPRAFFADQEEQSLFQELAIDIAFALHNIELEEKHKHAEEALQKSEEKYRSLTNDVLDSSAAGMFILDSDFRVVWVNRALEDYFDVKRDDIIGKDKRQLILERIKDIFENPDSFAHTIFTTYDDNTYIERFECHVLPDGTREERWLEHQSQPIQSGLYAGGRIEHYYNITARKQAEENLHQSEEKYRSLFEDSKDAIYITSRDGKFLDVNRAL